MTLFAKYDEVGRVVYCGDVPEAMISLQGDRVYVGEINGAIHYLADGRAHLRPANSAMLTGQQLVGLPVPCTIHINRASYPCADGEAALEIPYAGRYLIRVEAFPYLDSEHELNL